MLPKIMTFVALAGLTLMLTACGGTGNGTGNGGATPAETYSDDAVAPAVEGERGGHMPAE